MTVGKKLREISAVLETKGIESAPKEAESIVMEVLRIGRSSLYTDDPEIPDDIARRMDSLAQRRAAGEPLQYIIGHVDFHGLKITVGPGVLIPRPETELLVEEVLKRISKDSSPRILDLCTGSGCVALALAKNIPASDVYAVDVSEKALAYARENAQANGISNITFLKGSLFGPVRDMRFDVIASNPPYIRSADIKTLQPEIRDWEPVEALDGGRDGLAFYREIIGGAHDFLLSGGFAALELGYGLKEAVEEIARGAGYQALFTEKDYAGIDRVLCIRSD